MLINCLIFLSQKISVEKEVGKANDKIKLRLRGKTETADQEFKSFSPDSSDAVGDDFQALLKSWQYVWKLVR